MTRADRFTAALAAATMGVYTVILAGASTAISEATQACTSWPTCGGVWITVKSPAVLIVWAHRLLAVVVGLSIVAIAISAWSRSVDRRVKAALAIAVALYPIQIGLGAARATASDWLPGSAHLGTGLAIFGALILALAWHLEHDDASDSPTSTQSRHSSGKAPSPLPVSGLLGTALAYVRLMKPRLMWLLCLVAAAGMALAAGPSLTTRTIVLTLGGGVLAIGASGTFNHVFERDIDRKMARTSDRPVVQDVVPVRNAAAFGLALSLLSLVVFLQVNVLSAVLGAVAIAYYAVIYTLVLKPNTVLNTLIGGVAGAIPALIGSAAVTGTLGWGGIGLATLIFVWTPAHFYNLALAYKDDYERGGFPMLPVVRGEAITRKRILQYLGATLIITAILGWGTSLGSVYIVAATTVGAVFLWAVIRLHHERTRTAAFRAFHASNAFLGAVLIAVVIDSMVV